MALQRGLRMLCSVHAGVLFATLRCDSCFVPFVPVPLTASKVMQAPVITYFPPSFRPLKTFYKALLRSICFPFH